jgi:tetratricopeptide (TPR) repeat protein
MLDKRYSEAEGFFKEALKILKQAGQDKSMSYLYVLKRLAYVCFLDRRYSESEKYFKVANDLTPLVTKNPSNLFSSQKNMLLFYTYCNLDKAQQLGDQMMREL